MTIIYTVAVIITWAAGSTILAPLVGAFMNGGRSDEVTFGECWW